MEILYSIYFSFSTQSKLNLASFPDYNKEKLKIYPNHKKEAFSMKAKQIDKENQINKEKQINTYIDDTFNVYLDKTRNVGELEYTVLDESIVRVDNTGKVSAIGLGETIVKFKDEVNG